VTLVREDAFLAIAKSRDEPAVLLCDRGAMDGLAYLPDECWPRLLERAGVAAEDLQRRWYDAVVHLVTAAEGAEEQCHSLNNTTRYENVEQARNVDHRLRLAWRGPWRVEIIDNSTDFARKLDRAVEVVCRVVGLSRPE